VRFSGEPVYLEGQSPSEDEVQARVERYWRPYHALLVEELQRLRTKHGRVLLWEGHSIRGEVPFLFEGTLPDLNVGTSSGASCAPELQARLERVLSAQRDYTWVANGRFKGGYITRHYGRPAEGVDAVQLELSQRNYMDEDSFEYDEARAGRLLPTLRALLDAALAA
jgi:N-formylglutamate deformylase